MGSIYCGAAAPELTQFTGSAWRRFREHVEQSKLPSVAVWRYKQTPINLFGEDEHSTRCATLPTNGLLNVIRLLDNCMDGELDKNC